ncbi:hypothetical protein BOTBODRAFT_34847 [Botryobasidium botryosum FD-172 SS1]|uniref:Uncharacterized protein n=1 Tax=Botryobasidium botryosum (strain FD-172 SS1) TaxID=930990 RepID=A0A067M888_BOTB1|nr:hypothetical protein BOTBODRAFT_34847 [Botryobasidium botryosum FD-172 SS1]
MTPSSRLQRERSKVQRVWMRLQAEEAQIKQEESSLLMLDERIEALLHRLERAARKFEAEALATQILVTEERRRERLEKVTKLLGRELKWFQKGLEKAKSYRTEEMGDSDTSAVSWDEIDDLWKVEELHARRRLDRATAHWRESQDRILNDSRRLKRIQRERLEDERLQAKREDERWRGYMSDGERPKGWKQQLARPAVPPKVVSRETVGQVWESYQSRWKDIIAGTSPGPLTFQDIPWPVAFQVLSPASLTADRIEKFILSPDHSSDRTRKQRIRDSMLIWHPDKWEGRWMARVSEKDRGKVREGVEAVARCLTSLVEAERAL